MLNQAQITELKRRAKAQGISEADVDASVAQMMQEFNSQSQSPTAGAASVSSPAPAAPTQQQPAPQQGSQQLSKFALEQTTNDNIVSGFFKSLYNTAANYGSFVGESALQASRAGAEVIGSATGMTSEPTIFGAGEIQKKIEELSKQSKENIKLAKESIDPNARNMYAQKSRDIDAEIERLGQEAKKIGDKKTTFLVNEDKIENRGEIAMQGAKTTAGAAALAVPGGGSAKAMMAAGAAGGALSGFSASDGDTFEEVGSDVLTGLATGAVISGATAGIIKVMRSNIASKAGQKLDDAGNEITTRAYVKGVGIKPLKGEGGAKLLDRMKQVGIVPGDADAIIAQTDDIYRQDGGRVLEATRKLGEQGVEISTADIKAELIKQLNAAKSSVTRKPIQQVLDTIDEDLAGRVSITPDELYLLKSEYGALGKWNSTSSVVEKQQAEAWRSAYIQANDLLDATLKKNGFTEFAEINQRLHTANQAAQWATRKSEIAPNVYNVGLYDWLAGVAGTIASGGNLLGGVAVMGTKKAMESGKASEIAARIATKAGETLQRVGPVNASMNQTVLNAGIAGTTRSIVKDPTKPEPNKINDTKNQNLNGEGGIPSDTNQNESSDNFNQISPSITANSPILPRDNTPKPFGGRSKLELLQLALAQGATKKDLQEIADIYDMIVPAEADVDKLLTKRKSLADAGFDTSSVDQQLEALGIRKLSSSNAPDLTTQINNISTVGERNNARATKDILDVVDAAIEGAKGTPTGPISAAMANYSKLTGPNRTAQLEKDLAEILRTVRKESTGVAFSPQEIEALQTEIPSIVQQEGNVEDSLKRLRVRMLQKLGNYGIDVSGELNKNETQNQ